MLTTIGYKYVHSILVLTEHPQTSSDVGTQNRPHHLSGCHLAITGILHLIFTAISDEVGSSHPSSPAAHPHYTFHLTSHIIIIIIINVINIILCHHCILPHFTVY